MSELKNTIDELRKGQESWVNIIAWHDFLVRNKVNYVKGARDNMTDGEVHYILNIGNKKFSLHANYWSFDTGWEEGIKWVLLNK